MKQLLNNYRESPESEHVYFLGENQWVYASAAGTKPPFNCGDIVEVPFPFTDLSGFKTRPALVLAISKMDITVVYISSHHSWAAYEDFLLQPTAENGLSVLSLVRIGKIFSISPSLVIRKTGVISEIDLDVAKWCLNCFFGMKPGMIEQSQLSDEPDGQKFYS